jgi:hypothetical protein
VVVEERQPHVKQDHMNQELAESFVESFKTKGNVAAACSKLIDRYYSEGYDKYDDSLNVVIDSMSYQRLKDYSPQSKNDLIITIKDQGTKKNRINDVVMDERQPNNEATAAPARFYLLNKPLKNTREFILRNCQ